MGTYGRDFAAVYNAMWGFWGPKMWPFLSAQVARRCPRARTWRGTWIRRGRDCTIIGESACDPRTHLACLRLTGFVRQGRLYRRLEEEHVQRGYTREEMDALLERAGFGFTRYNGNALNRRIARAARLLYVCWRA